MLAQQLMIQFEPFNLRPGRVSRRCCQLLRFQLRAEPVVCIRLRHGTHLPRLGRSYSGLLHLRPLRNRCEPIGLRRSSDPPGTTSPPGAADLPYPRPGQQR